MPQPNPFPVSITLARRLAEVADSFRQFKEVVLVAQRVFPKPPDDPYFPDSPVYGFRTPEEANEYFLDKKLDEKEWGIFGPYTVTQNDKPIKWDIKEVESATITVRFKYEPQDEVVELDERTDTIFLNLSSFDKFAMPYYTKLYGVDYASKLRKYILEECQAKGIDGMKLLSIIKPMSRSLVKGSD